MAYDETTGHTPAAGFRIDTEEIIDASDRIRDLDQCCSSALWA